MRLRCAHTAPHVKSGYMEKEELNKLPTERHDSFYICLLFVVPFPYTTLRPHDHQENQNII